MLVLMTVRSDELVILLVVVVAADTVGGALILIVDVDLNGFTVKNYAELLGLCEEGNNWSMVGVGSLISVDSGALALAPVAKHDGLFKSEVVLLSIDCNLKLAVGGGEGKKLHEVVLELGTDFPAESVRLNHLEGHGEVRVARRLVMGKKIVAALFDVETESDVIVGTEVLVAQDAAVIVLATEKTVLKLLPIGELRVEKTESRETDLRKDDVLEGHHDADIIEERPGGLAYGVGKDKNFLFLAPKRLLMSSLLGARHLDLHLGVEYVLNHIKHFEGKILSLGMDVLRKLNPYFHAVQ